MSGQEASIRGAGQHDLQPLLALYGQLNPADPAISAEQAQAAFATMLSHPGMTILVADLAGLPVSSVTLIVIPNLTRAASPYAVIENVVTHAAHRKQGHAGRLITEAIRRAWDARCYKVMLLTGSKEPATLRFYEGCGFSQNKTGFQIRRPD